MSGAIHLISSRVPGYCLSDGRCLPCSGISGRAIMPSYSYHRDHKLFPKVKLLLKKSPVYGSKGTVFSCSSSSSNHRRNPDFSRQNRQGYGFSRGKNRQNQEKEDPENLEDSVLLSSKNGPLLSISSNPRFQATATPGPREKEIVDLFRKVQTQLRERAAMKEERKIEASRGQEEKGTVDSLLRLLRKHSSEQGKKKVSDEDYNLEQPEKNRSFDEEKNSNISDSNTISNISDSNAIITEESQESGGVPFTRPASKFQRKSPVPQVKYQPVYSTGDGLAENTFSKSQGKRKKKLDPNPELESSTVSDEVFDVAPDLTSDLEEAYIEIPEAPSSKETNLSSLKLPELRVLAKSRGIKGYSKLKKGELVQLLNEDAS